MCEYGRSAKNKLVADSPTGKQVSEEETRATALGALAHNKNFKTPTKPCTREMMIFYLLNSQKNCSERTSPCGLVVLFGGMRQRAAGVYHCIAPMQQSERNNTRLFCGSTRQGRSSLSGNGLGMCHITVSEHHLGWRPCLSVLVVFERSPR